MCYKDSESEWCFINQASGNQKYIRTDAHGVIANFQQSEAASIESLLGQNHEERFIRTKDNEQSTHMPIALIKKLWSITALLICLRFPLIIFSIFLQWFFLHNISFPKVRWTMGLFLTLSTWNNCENDYPSLRVEKEMHCLKSIMRSKKDSKRYLMNTVLDSSCWNCFCSWF